MPVFVAGEENMRTALVVTREEPKTSRRMSAEEFVAALEANPDFINQTETFDLDTDNPVHFRQAHTRFGGEQSVRACFAFAAGHAPDQDHIFGHKLENISVIEAAQRGKKILLSLNADLTNRPVNYRVLRDPLTTKLEDWMAEHRGNYFIQSVKTAEELVALLRRLKQEVPEYSLAQNLKILHRGAVMGYKQFFMRANEDNFQQLYHTMRDGITGMATNSSQTRIIGFPRLMEFNMAATTRNQKGVQGIRSTPYPDKGTKLVNLLVMKGHTKEPSVLQREWAEISAMGPSFYVMAAPVIAPDNRANGRWKPILWVVNDPVAQLAKKSQPPVQKTASNDPRATGDLFSQPAAA